MFPEGTRRQKGLRKKHEARWHTGAARIALEAGVPLIPAGSREPTVSRGSARCVFGTALPSRSPISMGWRRPILRRSPPTGYGTRLPSWRSRSREAAPRRRRRFVRTPRLPCDPEVSSAERRWAREHALRVRDDAPAALAGRATTHRPSWDTLEVPTYRHEALDVYQSGRSSRQSSGAARPPSRARRLVRARVREGAWLRGGRLPRRCGLGRGRARRDRARRDLGSRRVPARRRADRDSAARARRGTGSDRAAEVRERYGVDPEQVPDFIALRGDPSIASPEPAGSGRRRRRTCLHSTGR